MIIEVVQTPIVLLDLLHLDLFALTFRQLTSDVNPHLCVPPSHDKHVLSLSSSIVSTDLDQIWKWIVLSPLQG